MQTASDEPHFSLRIFDNILEYSRICGNVSECIWMFQKVPDRSRSFEIDLDFEVLELIDSKATRLLRH